MKNKKKTRFIGDSASHQNGASDRAINMVVTMKITMFMHAALICTNDTLSNDFSNGNGLCCMDIHMDTRYVVWSISY